MYDTQTLRLVQRYFQISLGTCRIAYLWVIAGPPVRLKFCVFHIVSNASHTALKRMMRENIKQLRVSLKIKHEKKFIWIWTKLFLRAIRISLICTGSKIKQLLWFVMSTCFIFFFGIHLAKTIFLPFFFNRNVFLDTFNFVKKNLTCIRIQAGNQANTSDKRSGSSHKRKPDTTQTRA